MKKMSIVINGQHEEEIGLEILQGIYAAIQNHGYTDVSVQAETVNQCKEIEIPAFLTGYARGAAATVSLDSYRQPCRALKPRQSTSPS